MTATVLDTYVRAFAEAKHRLPGAGLGAARERALERFLAHGFPTVKVEAWKFTNLSPLAATPFRPAEGAALDAAVLAGHRLAGAFCAVFVNGLFRPELSDLAGLPAGARVRPLAEVLKTEPDAIGAAHDSGDRATALAELNFALARDGAVVELAAGVALERPLQLLFVAAPEAGPTLALPRNRIVLDAGAAATIVETHVSAGAGATWTNTVTDGRLGPKATLRHGVRQTLAPDAFLTARGAWRLDEGARYDALTLAAGARLARHETAVTFAAEQAECRLDGVTLLRGAQHADMTTRLDHARPQGTSRQRFKSVVEDQAHAVYQGQVRVAPGAVKTDAEQLSRALLLSDAAQADAKPELEILADDVKCSHGATVGDLDRDALFYLRARGLDVPEARALLIGAFAAEAIDAIEHPAVKDHFRAALTRWLGFGGGMA